MRDHVLQTAAAERRLKVGAHEVGYQPPEHFLTPIAELAEPAIADVNDPTVRVHRVQHRGGRAVELTVALLDPRLLPDLRVDGHGAQVIALGAALDDRAREAVDAIAFPRPEIDRHAVEPAGPAQQRHELLGDSRRRLGAAEVLRTNVRDLVAGVTETQEPCVARIEEIPFLVQRHGERRTLPEQPLVAILDRHGGYFTEFRQPQQRSFVIYENPLGPHVPNPLFIKRRTLGTPRA